MIEELTDEANDMEIINKLNEVIKSVNRSEGKIRHSGKQTVSLWFNTNKDRIIDRLKVNPVPAEILSMLMEEEEDLFLELNREDKSKIIRRGNLLINKYNLPNLELILDKINGIENLKDRFELISTTIFSSLSMLSEEGRIYVILEMLPQLKLADKTVKIMEENKNE